MALEVTKSSQAVAAKNKAEGRSLAKNEVSRKSLMFIELWSGSNKKGMVNQDKRTSQERQVEGPIS